MFVNSFVFKYFCRSSVFSSVCFILYCKLINVNPLSVNVNWSGMSVCYYIFLGSSIGFWTNTHAHIHRAVERETRAPELIPRGPHNLTYFTTYPQHILNGYWMALRLNFSPWVSLKKLKIFFCFYILLIHTGYTFSNYKSTVQSIKARIFQNSVKPLFFLSFSICIPGSHENPEPGVNHPWLPFVSATYKPIRILIVNLEKRNTEMPVWKCRPFEHGFRSIGSWIMKHQFSLWWQSLT